MDINMENVQQQVLYLHKNAIFTHTNKIICMYKGQLLLAENPIEMSEMLNELWNK